MQSNIDVATIYRPITEREIEILELISSGHSTIEIASDLFLSPETIKTYRKSLMNKFGARNMAQLIRIAFEKGVIA
ncbi:MAG: helix-turn-helix transcriptional regulator [Saprospiraceae bacterium]|nr:helix-turn-helix transcriptional regulator [Saprospiraceae bacterium]